jgi:hypothetical protein
MAYNGAPSNWMTGYSLASSQARFNTDSAGSDQLLTKLTDAQANATTGDVRDVFRSLCYMMSEAWTDQTSANRPVKMTIRKQVIALADNVTLRETYTMTFDVESDPQAVVPEP